MNHVLEDMLLHYGTPMRSGRYPYGSGKDPYQHSGDFLSRIEELKKQKFTMKDENGNLLTGDTAIAKSMGMNTTEFRTQMSIAKEERRALLVDTANNLRNKGYSLNEIAAKMGYKNDSSVRSLLNKDSAARMLQAKNTSEFLKKQILEKGMIDVGAGVERELGISKEKFNEALYMLQMEGYPVYKRRVEQATNRKNWTTVTVIGPPGTEYAETYDSSKINSLRDYITHDNGKTFETFQYPASVSSKRLKIRFAEEGGVDKDGVVEIRPGVKDLSLGESKYAQVRILVDGTHYIKGMAVYSDNLPDGIDMVFNSNKPSSVGKMGALKKIKEDPQNPFGSLIKEKGGQSYYEDENGVKHLSAINKRAEEGDWGEWSDKLSSQFLSKQSKSLMEKQLKLTLAEKRAEYDEICAYTNPTVKKALLENFASECDSTAVHLDAAALPRQQYKVILPLTSIKDNEVYAPHCKDGESVALIRYPHGGTFEIPILKVNNGNQEGKKVIGTTPMDAIGINSKVAGRLSGADFDGDTVMVIPTGRKINITSTPPLKGLEGFDTTMSYGPDSNEPVKVDSKTGREYYSRNGKTYGVMRNTQIQMGIVSNLITDMTLKGANPEEIARAVKHSMVVIDAEKHKLDYKASEKDNDIASLKKKYQGHYDENGKYHEGSSTLISRSNAEIDVLKRKGSPKIDPETGKVSYTEVREEYIGKDGKTHLRTQKSTRMAETDNAYTLVSDANSVAEHLYADYANNMKLMANNARKEMLSTKKIPYSASAHEAYKKEVANLDAQLNVSLLNAPRERQAQLMADSVIKAKKQANPDMTPKEIKKASQQALSDARIKVGAKRHPIVIDDRSWEAIQSGAISENKLKNILKYADMGDIKQRAMPRTRTTLSPSKINHMQRLRESGYTTAQIADQLGVSTSTVTRYMSGKE